MVVITEAENAYRLFLGVVFFTHSAVSLLKF